MGRDDEERIWGNQGKNYTSWSLGMGGFQMVGECGWRAPVPVLVATFRSLVQYPLGRGWGMEGRLNDLSGQSPPYCPILTTK